MEGSALDPPGGTNGPGWGGVGGGDETCWQLGVCFPALWLISKCPACSHPHCRPAPKATREHTPQYYHHTEIARHRVGLIHMLTPPTMPCSHMQDSGTCTSGLHCRFAHGEAELLPHLVTRATLCPIYQVSHAVPHISGEPQCAPYFR